MSKPYSNGIISSDGFIVYGREATTNEKAHSQIHTCGTIMQYNKHGVLVCPTCRPPIIKNSRCRKNIPPINTTLQTTNTNTSKVYKYKKWHTQKTIPL
jgi:hypothetical protein